MLTQLCSQRPTWKAVDPPSSQGVVGRSSQCVRGSTQSTPGASGFTSTPTLSGSSQDIPTTSTPGLHSLYLFCMFIDLDQSQLRCLQWWGTRQILSLSRTRNSCRCAGSNLWSSAWSELPLKLSIRRSCSLMPSLRVPLSCKSSKVHLFALPWIKHLVPCLCICDFSTTMCTSPR